MTGNELKLGVHVQYSCPSQDIAVDFLRESKKVQCGEFSAIKW